MSIRRVFIPVAMALTLLLQFVPGTVFAPRPVAAQACDSALFVADVTIPDGTTVAPGATFVKTWRLENNGTCTWSTSYSAVFTSGDQLGAPAVVAMPSSVAPGVSVNITVNLTAPTTPGHYRGNWKLRNASGGIFGVGTYANSIFWVDIYVSGSVSTSTSYDFIAHACDANVVWSTGGGTLACPGIVASPQLENGSVDPNPGLIVNPQQVAGGYIQGVYPAYMVQSGDHFQGIINCAYNAPSCYVNFRLMYKIGSGPVQTFWSFNERYDGLYYRVNLDLSSLVGQSVNFILYVADVSGHGSPSGDHAEWVETKIAGNSGVYIPPIPPSTTCNRGYFVTDVTIPDGTVLAPGQSFTKTWEIRNIGSCTWTTSYGLVYVFGNPLGAASPTYLPAAVAPGATADFSVNMVAPSVAGHYRSYWRFHDASGHQFGVGSGMITFFADIYVSSTAPTSTPSSPTATPTATPTSVLSGPNADLSVTINDGRSTYTLGGSTTYTVVVSNSGPSNVTGAGVSIPIPGNITSWTVACVADSGAVCTAIPPSGGGTGPITDSVTIPAGKKVTYTISASISGVAVGNLVTTATVTNPGATPDPNMANNSASDTDAPPSADLSISISDGTSVWTPGSSTTYSVEVDNLGPLNVTGAVFNDNKPSQVTNWSWTCTPVSGATCGAGSGGTITTAITDTANIPAGKSVAYTIIAHLTTTSAGNLVNIVTIAAPGGTPDPVSSNNSATDTDTGPSADLAVITNTDNVTYYTPSGTLNYTIRVFNFGPYAVTGATFTDNRPSQITGWTWACVHDTNSTCTAVPAGTNITDTINLAAGEGVTYSVVATVAAGPTGSLANIAEIAAPASVTDPASSNNSLTDTDFHQNADLAVSMTDGVTSFSSGGTVTYTITVTNSGPSNVTSGITFSDAKPSQVASWTWSCVANGLSAFCTGAASSSSNFTDATITIPVGGSIIYTAVAIAINPATGPMVNTAIINYPASALFPDPNTSNNTVTDTNSAP